MNCIHITEDYLNSLKVNNDGGCSRIYLDRARNIVYKIPSPGFFNRHNISKSRIEYIERLKFLKNSSLLKKLNFILPQDLIYIDNNFVGFTMQYFKSEYLHMSKKWLIKWLETCQNVMNYNILFDVTCLNFLIDKKDNVMICDVDTIQIGEYPLLTYYEHEIKYFLDHRQMLFVIAGTILNNLDILEFEFDEFMKSWCERAENYKSVVLSQLINHLRNKKGPRK